MDKFDEVMKIGLKELADEMIADIERWDREHPEEARKRDEYIEEHREEFMEKLMEKVHQLEREENKKTL